MSRRIASTSPPYSHDIRSKLLGWPTSIAFAIVAHRRPRRERPGVEYSGTTSLALVAATNRSIGRPARFAIRPAVRLPKLPLGVREDDVAAVAADAAPACCRTCATAWK